MDSTQPNTTSPRYWRKQGHARDDAAELADLARDHPHLEPEQVVALRDARYV